MHIADIHVFLALPVSVPAAPCTFYNRSIHLYHIATHFFKLSSNAPWICSGILTLSCSDHDQQHSLDLFMRSLLSLLSSQANQNADRLHNTNTGCKCFRLEHFRADVHDFRLLVTQLWCTVRASVLNWQCVLHETTAWLLITSARREFSFGPIFFWLHTDMGCGQKKGLTLSVHRENRSVWLQTFYDTNGGRYRRRKPTDLRDRLWVFF